MKTLEEIKKGLRDQKPALATKYKVKEIGIFGSYVRGEQQPQSDLDVLVDFEEYPSLLEFVGIEDELSEHLGIKVDLVMKSGLKPRIGQRILREVVYL
jgi:predicted nucleotidyltransferase